MTYGEERDILINLIDKDRLLRGICRAIRKEHPKVKVLKKEHITIHWNKLLIKYIPKQPSPFQRVSLQLDWYSDEQNWAINKPFHCDIKWLFNDPDIDWEVEKQLRWRDLQLNKIIP